MVKVPGIQLSNRKGNTTQYVQSSPIIIDSLTYPNDITIVAIPSSQCAQQLYSGAVFILSQSCLDVQCHVAYLNVLRFCFGTNIQSL